MMILSNCDWNLFFPTPAQFVQTLMEVDGVLGREKNC
jgi:hypothetical protein